MRLKMHRKTITKMNTFVGIGSRGLEAAGLLAAHGAQDVATTLAAHQHAPAVTCAHTTLKCQSLETLVTT